MATRIIDRGYNKIMREMNRAWRREAAVGIHAGDKNGDGANVAEYAAYNEYGTDEEPKIPSRPFMRTAFDENIAEIHKDFARETALLVTGKKTAHQCLLTVGLKHAARIQNTITGRDFLPKLSQQTIDAKKGSTKTLVDTGAMVNAVHAVVRPRT